MAKKKVTGNPEVKWRDRKFMLELYPDNETHVAALEMIKKSYDYAYILHDKDVFVQKDIDKQIKKYGAPHNAVGDFKKAHWHVFISFTGDCRWNTAIAKELGIDAKWTGEKVNKTDRALQYLVHLNDLDKYQYDISEVQGPLKEQVAKLINVDDREEEVKVKEITKYLRENNDIITLTDFTDWCIDNGYWDVFGTYKWTLFKDILKEHNKRVRYDRAKAKADSVNDNQQLLVTDRGNFSSYTQVYKYAKIHDINSVIIFKWQMGLVKFNLNQTLDQAELLFMAQQEYADGDIPEEEICNI